MKNARFKRKVLTVAGPAAMTLLSLGLVGSAQADLFLPNLENLNFLQYTGAPPKNSFTAVDPVGWTGGSGLIFIVAPGTSNTSPVTACGTT